MTSFQLEQIISSATENIEDQGRNRSGIDIDNAEKKKKKKILLICFKAKK